MSYTDIKFAIEKANEKDCFHMYELQSSIFRDNKEYYLGTPEDKANLKQTIDIYINNGINFGVTTWRKHHIRGWELS